MINNASAIKYQFIQLISEKVGNLLATLIKHELSSLSGTELTSSKKYDLMNQVNARGTWLVSKHALPHLKKSSNAHILNICPPLSFEERWVFSGGWGDLCFHQVFTTRGLFYRQVRNEHVCAGNGWRVSTPQHCRECIVAKDDDSNCGNVHDSGCFRYKQNAQTHHHGRCRLRDFESTQLGVQVTATQCV